MGRLFYLKYKKNKNPIACINKQQKHLSQTAKNDKIKVWKTFKLATFYRFATANPNSYYCLNLDNFNNSHARVNY